MKKTIQIAIDGPSGAGKSTVAKKIANILKLEYVDTGAMYRALAYKFIKNEFKEYEKIDKLSIILQDTNIDFKNGKLILDNNDISALIRDEDIGMLASKISAIPEIRNFMVDLQRSIASNHDVIMDGRDVGTVILKNTKFKYYLTASLEERARRRYLQLKESGKAPVLSDVLEMIKKRDYDDMNRTHSPLMKAESAVEIDCTDLTEDETVNLIIKSIKEKQNAI